MWLMTVYIFFIDLSFCFSCKMCFFSAEFENKTIVIIPGFPNFQLIIWATVTTFTEPLRHFIRSLAISRTFSSASGHLADLSLIHYLYKQLRLNNFLRPIFQVKSCWSASLLTNFVSSGADQRLLTWEELRPVILCSLSSRSRMDSMDCDRTPVKNQNYQ